MNALPVILIFDVGKTNKKVLLFNQEYKLVLEKSVQLPEATDEDGDPCEDVALLSNWIMEMFREISADSAYEIVAVNFSAYGASFVHLGQNDKPASPLYNYLKPFPPELRNQFYDTYGGEVTVSKQTASPVLGNLNSGLQLYRLRYQKPDTFNQIKYSLHLPQFLSYLISGNTCSDITSIGCHTCLWDFTRSGYHEWVYREGIEAKLAPIRNGDDVVHIDLGGRRVAVGVGLHDSSAALIPYLSNFHEPFILISTGTWCISLNPYNQSPLTEDELKKDCLLYLAYKGNPVKASRLFAGYEHEEQVKRLAGFFKVEVNYYKQVAYNRNLISKLRDNPQVSGEGEAMNPGKSLFGGRDLGEFNNYEEAYHQLISDLVQQQLLSTNLVLKDSRVKRIFVDGGFSKNPIYMHLLAAAFPDIEIFAASVAQATAMGAALAIHRFWNKNPLPENIIDLKYYTLSHDLEV